MTRAPRNASQADDPRIERVFVERERNRFAGRALLSLVLLNGAAGLILLAIIAQAPDSTVDRKIATAMLFFSGGAVAALLSSFLAYINRTVRMQVAGREDIRRILRGFAVAAVIGSGAAFFVGMNMVATAQSERSSSHPKGSREDKPAKGGSSEKVGAAREPVPGELRI